MAEMSMVEKVARAIYIEWSRDAGKEESWAGHDRRRAQRQGWVRMKRFLKYLVEAIRGFYPFLTCLVGGLFFVVLPFEESGLVRFVSVLLGGCCYAWAIDLAETRAKAEASSKAAAQIIDALTSGLDTEFRATIYDKRQEF